MLEEHDSFFPSWLDVSDDLPSASGELRATACFAFCPRGVNAARTDQNKEIGSTLRPFGSFGDHLVLTSIREGRARREAPQGIKLQSACFPTAHGLNGETVMYSLGGYEMGGFIGNPAVVVNSPVVILGGGNFIRSKRDQ